MLDVIILLCEILQRQYFSSGLCYSDMVISGSSSISYSYKLFNTSSVCNYGKYFKYIFPHRIIFKQ